MTEELQKKVDRAIKLLQSTCKDQQVELCLEEDCLMTA